MYYGTAPPDKNIFQSAYVSITRGFHNCFQNRIHAKILLIFIAGQIINHDR